MDDTSKTAILLKVSETELAWMRWAIQDGHIRGVEERLIRERLSRRIEDGLGIKPKESNDG